jgi:subtilisin family serine protease
MPWGAFQVMRLKLLGLFLGLVAPACAGASMPTVAIIDSGVAPVGELSRLLLAEYDLGSHKPRPAFRPSFDHGTMVATILARALDDQVKILSLRIDDPHGCPEGRNPPCQPSPQPMAAAIRLATAHKVDAINISLALADDPAITAAIAAAAAKGIKVVMAAGNEGYDHPNNLNMAMAGYPNTVLVGALDAAGKPWAQSNRPGPDAGLKYSYAWQLGVGVPTRLADGRAAKAIGTSFAAPLETARLLQAKLTAPGGGGGIIEVARR